MGVSSVIDKLIRDITTSDRLIGMFTDKPLDDGVNAHSMQWV